MTNLLLVTGKASLRQLSLPVLGVGPQPFKDPGQLTGDHGSALAEQQAFIAPDDVTPWQTAAQGGRMT